MSCTHLIHGKIPLNQSNLSENPSKVYLQIICKSYTRKIQFSQNSRFQKMEKPNPKENVVLRKHQKI